MGLYKYNYDLIRKIRAMKNLYKFFLVSLALTGTIITKSQVTDLNSYPSASNVILLDFNGHTVSGTMWNVNGAFTCVPLVLM
jgi:hypothetical protein